LLCSALGSQELKGNLFDAAALWDCMAVRKSDPVSHEEKKEFFRLDKRILFQEENAWFLLFFQSDVSLLVFSG
jgi:uncharacterized protein (UPF0335 family)